MTLVLFCILFLAGMAWSTSRQNNSLKLTESPVAKKTALVILSWITASVLDRVRDEGDGAGRNRIDEIWLAYTATGSDDPFVSC